MDVHQKQSLVFIKCLIKVTDYKNQLTGWFLSNEDKMYLLCVLNAYKQLISSQLKSHSQGVNVPNMIVNQPSSSSEQWLSHHSPRWLWCASHVKPNYFENLLTFLPTFKVLFLVNHMLERQSGRKALRVDPKWRGADLNSYWWTSC